ncbi:hypothetical protein [Cellulomonas sp. RIT-PI-Y]|uniref:hypothetical protein n=1 Tax=Cellulomonas sp. RIT-PI-Y TaxID=3035297 RepID=UPI0021DB4344|nr:hypothetical protein [Cellulomonas sp. RIT-PI-Y]
MREHESTVIAEPSDAATLRQIAGEFNLTAEAARELLELGGGHALDEVLSPRVSVIYRLVLRGVL